MNYFSNIDNLITCDLCPHNCALDNNEIGICKVYQNQNDKIVITNNNKISTIAVEPIEKKPIFHYAPNSKVLSVGFTGCNLSCQNCINHNVSQNTNSATKEYAPKELILLAKEKQCQGICFTYNEPTLYIDYLIQVADLCHQTNLFVVLKTNGFLNNKPWQKLCEYIDVMNIDYKGNKKNYVSCGVADGYEQILRNILYVSGKIHVEISIPVYNNSRYEDFDDISLVLGEKKAVHLLKMFPSYKMMELIPTGDDKILEMRKEFLNDFQNVYAHNIFSDDGIKARYSYVKGEIVAKRDKYKTEIIHKGKCSNECGIRKLSELPK